MGSIDWEKLKNILEVIVLLWGILWGLISSLMLLWMREKFVPRKTFDETVKRLDMATAECRAGSARENAEIVKEMGDISKTVGRLDERSIGTEKTLDKIGDAVDRIDSFLMSQRAA